MDNFHKDLTQGSVVKQLLRFAIPFMLSNLLQALYSVADMVIVGQFCGKVGITGVSIGSQINILVTGAAMGLSIGGTVMIAQYGGQKRFDQQRKTIGNVTTLYLILSVIVTAVMLTVGRGLLVVLNTPQSAFTEAENYYNICMAGTVFMFLYNAISGVLRGMGDSKRPLWFVLIAAVTNIVLDLLLVGKFHMRAAGAAWATITAQALSVIISLIYLARNNFFSGYTLEDFKIEGQKLRSLVKIGLPSSVQSLVVSLSFLTLTALVNSLPNAEIASACQGIGGKINSFAILPALAISSAISSMAGQNIGAGEFKRAKKTMYVGMVMAFAISAVVFALVNLFPEFMIRLFDTEPELLEVGVPYLHWLTFDYLLVAIAFCINGLAIAAGSTHIALINAFFSSIFIRVPLAYLLVNMFGLGFNGVGMAMGFATVGSIVIGFIYVRSGKWKKRIVK